MSWDKLSSVYDWPKSPSIDPAEKAALALCEAISIDSDESLLASVLRRARFFFSNDEIAQLVLCILAVNDLNQLCSTV